MFVNPLRANAAGRRSWMRSDKKLQKNWQGTWKRR